MDDSGEAVLDRGDPSTDVAELRAQVAALGPWFHDLDLGHGIRTAPNHPLGSFLQDIWSVVRNCVPEDLRGATVLDIGCNAGFYSMQLARRGARVVGIDSDARYLEQARFAASVTGLDIDYRLLDVYDVASLGTTFDYVLFMGVFYHLRHPLLALERVAERFERRLIVQSMIRGVAGSIDVPPDMPITERAIFEHPRYPAMYFVERRYAGDPTNWWIPNEHGMEAMLRSVGLSIVDHPIQELWVCERAAPDG